jgi:electron transport complex protein RnfG
MASRGVDSSVGRSLRAAAVLAAATVVAAGLVSVVHDLAQPRIEATRHARQIRELTAVLGDVVFDNDPLADTVLVRDAELLGTDAAVVAHRARRGGAPVAVLLNVVAPDGYSGAIELLVAIDTGGRVLGVRVTGHRETPGLGDAIEERRSSWIHGFDGRSLGDPPEETWRVRKDGGDFDQFTGATVTPRAVVHAVRNALLYFERHREELLAAPAASPGAVAPPTADSSSAARPPVE